MKSLNKIFIFLIVLFIAKLIADQVVRNNYIIVLLAFAAFCYMIYSTWYQKITFLSLATFIPFAVPRGIPVPFDKWIEVLAPVFTFYFLFFEILLHKRTPFSKKSALFLAAVAVLGLWAIVNYIKNPVLGSITFGSGSQEGGIRSYYLIFVGISTFLCSLWFFTYKDLNVQRWFWTLMIICLIIGDLRIIGYFNNYELPFLGGTFRFGVYAHYVYDLYRKGAEKASIGIGGLREMAALGIPLIICILYRGKFTFYSTIALINTVAFVILGGGRSNFVGVVAAISLFMLLFKRKYLWPAMLSLLILVAILLLSGSAISPKYGRVLILEGGMEKQSVDRYYTFIYMWEVFKTSPIFGKGIGYSGVERSEIFNEIFKKVGPVDRTNFATAIEGGASTGGHGAYLAMLGIFGIGGIFFLAVMLFGGIYYAYKVIRVRNELSDEVILALFAFLYLIILAFTFVAGGNGYENVELWFIAGMIAGLRAKERIKHVTI